MTQLFTEYGMTNEITKRTPNDTIAEIKKTLK